jgi:hypothetical protein
LSNGALFRLAPFRLARRVSFASSLSI